MTNFNGIIKPEDNYMSTFKKSVKELPSYETLLERYKFLKQFEGDYFSFHEDNPEYVWVRWENGGGDEATLVLYNDKKHALLYGYDHESDLNFFDEPELQTVFNDIVEPYKSLIETDTLAWSWDENRFIFATCGFWLKENEWLYSQEYERKTEWEDDKNSFSYVLGCFLNSEKEIEKRFEKNCK